MTMSTKGYHDSSPHCIAVVLSVVLACAIHAFIEPAFVTCRWPEASIVYWASSDDAFPPSLMLFVRRL